MVPNELIASQLVRPSERAPIIILRPERPSRLRPVYVCFKFWELLVSLLLLRLTGRLTDKRVGSRVRLYLEKMGALWIKAGKVLALRKDVLPEEVAAELDKLRDRGPGFPFAWARRVVEEELGAPLERYFDELSPVPFVSTTMAQVHEAHLKHENVWVAVKIQHPYAKQTYSADIRMIRRVARWLELLSIQPQMRWSDLVWELEQLMKSEIDSRFEAAALRKLSRTIQKHGVYFPDVFTQYSGEHMLVMEFIRGALVSDYIALQQSDPQRLAVWLQANNIDPKRVARRLFQTVYRQILEDNFFHADLHPGNVILLRDSRIAFIECRNAGSLETEQVTKLRLLVQALAEEEHAAAADYFFLLASSLPLIDLAELKAGMVRLMRTWKTEAYIHELDYAQKSITHLAGELNHLALKSGFSVQWSLSKMIGALANLDASLSHLWPQMNYLKQLKKYFQNAEARRGRAQLRDLDTRVANSILVARKLPRRLSDFLVFQQILSRREAQVIQGSATRFGTFLSAVLAVAAFVLLGAEIFLSFAFLGQYSHLPVRWLVGEQIFSGLSTLPPIPLWVWLLILAGVLAIQRSTARFSAKLSQPAVRIRPEDAAGTV